MQLTYKCYPCILDDLEGALTLLATDDKTARAVMEEAATLMAREGPDRKPPSYYITRVHRMLKKATGIEEPFAELRAKTNRIGVDLAKRIRKETGEMSPAEKFRLRVMWCVASNHLDFRTVGTGYGFNPGVIYSNLEKQVEKGLALDMVGELRQCASKVGKVLYIHDNVGEVAVDTVLIEELRNMGAHVVSALRGGPITSDATMDDGRAAGVFEAADEVILAGPDTLGIALDEMTDQLAEHLESADLVVSKGQANYYVLTEYIKKHDGRFAFLFSSKCDPVAEKFGLKGINNLVWLYES